ncbi:MAG: succinate dehydrogenase/fumarate reductase iron-sulfur subunit [Gammaproteobacteria bacterium]|nr:succinate dehydrogenase/fumarate reductase iron-sulfur subunit [Gammaproteobacteria bacterium]
MSTSTNPAGEQETATLAVRIWCGGEQGRWAEYRVAARENQTVLDVVTEVQRTHEPSLAYRFACRVGVCGSCAMTVNGQPRWTCRTHVRKVTGSGTLVIEPLRNLPRIKDLVCDLEPFIDTWQKAGATFKGGRTRHEPPHRVDPDSPARKRADAALQCINCAVCYSACDVVHWNRSYVGPAALNRAWTLMNDVRHVKRAETFDRAFGRDGCGSCHSQGNCVRFCPVELNPAGSIAGLKRMAFTGTEIRDDG